MSWASNQCAGWSLSLLEEKCSLSSVAVARRWRFWPEAWAKNTPSANAKPSSATRGAPAQVLAAGTLGIVDSRFGVFCRKTCLVACQMRGDLEMKASSLPQVLT